MKTRHLALIAGWSYVIIFFAAIFANFAMLDALKRAPLETVAEHGFMVRLGALAFLVAAVFDVIVAWVLYALYKQHPFSLPAAFFRVMHAVLMGAAVSALPRVFTETTAAGVLSHVTAFDTLWLIGLFFFGVHLILLCRVVKFIRVIPYFLFAAGVMYMVDTAAHLLIADYQRYAKVFLPLVAIPSIFGEMAFAVWLLIKGGKTQALPADGG
ncbi:MAG: DUF4386 domain-containing protein [Polyangiales bacterium]